MLNEGLCYNGKKRKMETTTKKKKFCLKTFKCRTKKCKRKCFACLFLWLLPNENHIMYDNNNNNKQKSRKSQQPNNRCLHDNNLLYLFPFCFFLFCFFLFSFLFSFSSSFFHPLSLLKLNVHFLYKCLL